MSPVDTLASLLLDRLAAPGRDGARAAVIVNDRDKAIDMIGAFAITNMLVVTPLGAVVGGFPPESPPVTEPAPVV